MILIYIRPPFWYLYFVHASARIARYGGLDPVYVCLCNGFTDGQVRSVCQEQQRRVSDIYKALGCAPKCGKCSRLVKELSRIEAPVAPLAEAAAQASPQRLAEDAATQRAYRIYFENDGPL
jgi:bacterioferritin-associated ferredoxin